MKKFFLKSFFLISINVFSSILLFSQIHIGYPFIVNYERYEFQAGLQSWMITQSPEGLMYFANNDGLLEFDGQNWQLYPVPDRTIVRAVMADTNGNIYIGSSTDFGYFKKTANGQLTYLSLLASSKIDKNEFSEIWKIHKIGNAIVFQSYNHLIFLENDSINVIKAPSMFHFSFNIKGKLFVVDKKKGIMEYKQNKLIQIEGAETLNNSEITSILPFKNGLLISTIDNGVFVYQNSKLSEWQNNVSVFLKDNQIYTAIRIDDNTIAFGTIQNGLVVCNNEGNTIMHINESKGLQNNTILCMNLDNNGNLWLGTDNGIDKVHVNSPFRLINKYNGISAGYTAILHNNILYLGTNRGVFYKDFNDCNYSSLYSNLFELIPETKGQVWTLQEVDNQLFCGHNNGTYIIKGGEATKISDIAGAWTFIQSKKHPEKIICGTYTGLILFEKKNNEWVFSKKIEGIDESCRIMELDENEDLWMSHGFKGLYHIFLNENFDAIKNVKFYNDQNGFETNLGINVTKLNGKIVFVSSTGVYEYEPNGDSVITSQYYNDLLGKKEINYVKEDSNGDIWYFSDKKLFVMRLLEDGSYSEIELPFKPLQGKFIGGFEFIYSVSSYDVLIGYENGFILYNNNFSKDYQKQFNAYIKEIKLSKTDSTIFGGKIFDKNTKNIKLNYKNNGLHFFFSAIDFESPEKLEFSTYMDGYDQIWTEWGSSKEREFTNLHEGNYVFYVKARNIYGTETIPVKYEFVIKPPFTRTKVAFLIYAIFTIGLIITIIFIVLKQIEKEKLKEKERQKQKYKEREQELQQEALIAEKEIIKLRNDKLRQEMKNKDKELAETTMQTINKNKFLISLKKDLIKVTSSTLDNNVKKHIKLSIKKIDEDINNEQNWKVFEKHFLNVHEEFLTRFKKEYPQITPSELRLCACLRMNLSSKEIASLFNISIRGVETSRYRLRKALNLDRQINLTDFILSF